MLYSSALLALSAITGTTTAFVVQAPKAAFSPTQLSSSSAWNPIDAKAGVSNTPLALTNVADKLPADTQLAKNIWDTLSPEIIQGGSLRTFRPSSDRVLLLLKTEGRPLFSKIELWHGPNYTPFKLQVYLEDGNLCPFNAVLETPYDNSIAVFNEGAMEFPMAACVESDIDDGFADVKRRLYESGDPQTIQGGALRTFAFKNNVASVQILLKTDGRHLQARIEILQGPNNNKQVIQVYSSDGQKRPLFAVFETPQAGCTVRVVNEGSVEYPLTACVEPYLVKADN